MQIAHSVLNHMFKIYFGQDIDSQPLTGPFDQWNFQLAHNLTSGPVTSKQIFRAYPILHLREKIFHCAYYRPSRLVFVVMKNGTEAARKVILGSVLN